MRISGLLMVLSGCSATLLPTADCTSNAQCQAAFGFGSVCNVDTALCDTTEIHPRCDAMTGPVEFPLDRDKYYLISTFFGREPAQVARYQAAALAIEQVNDETGLDGKEFTALHCSYEPDQGGDGLTTVEAVQEVGAWLADEVGVPVNIGPHGSSLCQDFFGVASREHGTLLISPSATSDALGSIDGDVSSDEQPGLFWRTAPPDGAQGLAIAVDMLTEFDPEGITNFRRAPSNTIAIVYQTGAYGEGLATIVAQEHRSRGGSSTQFPFSNDGDRSQVIAEIAGGPYQEVLVISSDAADYTEFLLGAGGNSWYDDIPIFITDGGRTTDVLTQAASASHLFPNIRGSVPKTPDSVVYDTFDAAYRSRYATSASNDSYTAQTYDATWMAIYGHAWALGQEASVGGLQIARGLRHLDSGPAFNIQASAWTSVSAALESGGSVNLTGASGPLDFDPITRQISAIIEVFTINAEGTNFVEDYTYQ